MVCSIVRPTKQPIQANDELEGHFLYVLEKMICQKNFDERYEYLEFVVWVVDEEAKKKELDHSFFENNFRNNHASK